MNRTVNTCYVRNCFFCGRCFYRRHGSNRCAHCKRLQQAPCPPENDHRRGSRRRAAATASAAGDDAKGGAARGKKKNKKKKATAKGKNGGGDGGGGEEPELVEEGMDSFSCDEPGGQADKALWDYEAGASEFPLEINKGTALFSEVPYWGV
jgi:hypothetical protein